jgi:hypothetical protein
MSNLSPQNEFALVVLIVAVAVGVLIWEVRRKRLPPPQK